MHAHPPDALDAEMVAQMAQIVELQPGPSHGAGFARRELADERGQDGVVAPGDRGHLPEGVVFLKVHVTMGFAERRFQFEIFGVYPALDHDFRLGRNDEVDGARLRHVDRRSHQTAGERDLIHGLGRFLNRRVGDRGRRADNDRRRHSFAQRLVFLPVHVGAGALFHRCVETEPSRRFHLRAIDAHVLDSGIGIAGDEARRAEIGRIVPAWRRNRNRQPVEALTRLVQRSPFQNDILAGRISNLARWYRIGHRPGPGPGHIVQVATEADPVYLGARRHRAHDHGNIVTFAL